MSKARFAPPLGFGMCRIRLLKSILPGVVSCNAVGRHPESSVKRWNSRRIGLSKTDNSEKPGPQITGPHSGVASLLSIPVDSPDGIIGRQGLVRFAGVGIDGPESAHASIRNIWPVLLGDFVMSLDHLCRVAAQIFQWRIEPFDEDSFHVIPIALDCALATAFPNHVGVAISLPRLPERDAAGLMRGRAIPAGRDATRFRPGLGMLTPAYLSKIFLGSRSGRLGR